MKTLVLIFSILILLSLDFFYLTITKKFMMDQIVSVQKFSPKLKIIPAFICYVFIFTGLFYFILKNHRPPLDAFFLGIVIYSIFELTNYSIFKNWKLETVMIDSIWGGILFWLTTILTYQVEKMLK